VLRVQGSDEYPPLQRKIWLKWGERRWTMRRHQPNLYQGPTGLGTLGVVYRVAWRGIDDDARNGCAKLM